MGDACGFGHLLELGAVIEGHGEHARPLARPVGRPVHLLELAVLPERAFARAVLEEVAELLEARDRRGAAVARDREGAAGVGVGTTGLDRLVAQIAAEEAAHEGIARAQHVEHLDREAWPLDALLDVVRNCAVEHGAAHRPPLDHDQRRGRQLTNPAAGGERVGRAAGDVDLLLGADDHVARGQDGLQMGGYVLIGDEALLAEAETGQPPEHRAVVDVEHDLAAVLLHQPHRFLAHGVEVRLREVSARDQHRLGRGDEGLVDVVLGQARIGAVLAVEDQRKGLAVADAEDDQGGQPLGVGLDMADVDALLGRLLLDEAAHVLVADAGDQGGPETEPRRADRDVGRAAADILGEARHVLEPAADLLAIQIDRRAADADHIELPGACLRTRHAAPRFRRVVIRAYG